MTAYANVSAERAILGAILLDNRNYELAEKGLSVGDFLIEAHRKIFRSMASLSGSGQPIDHVTLIDELNRRRELDSIGGHAYIGSLVDGVPDGPNVNTYIRIMRSHAAERRVVLTAEAMAGSPSGNDLPQLCEVMRDNLDALAGEQANHVTQIENQRADMPITVLDGHLGEICFRRLRDFPLAYSWGPLVAAGGALIQKQRGIRTNLFFASVGPPASSKSTAQENSYRVLGLWNDPLLMKGKFGSAEGLLQVLSDVESGNARLIFPDELGHLLAKANLDGASFPYFLSTAYYEDQQTITIAKGKRIDLNCRLSVAGGMVEETFGALFGAGTTGGLYDRFIFGLCPEPFTYLYRPFEGQAESVTPFPVTIAPDVWDARDEWVRDYPGLTPRIAEHAIRVAVICAAFDGRPSLRAVELGPALAFAQYQVRVRAVLKPNPGENPDARSAFAIRSWLEEHAGDGRQVPRRALYRAIHGERLGPGVFDRAIKNMSFNQEVRISKQGKQETVSLIVLDKKKGLPMVPMVSAPQPETSPPRARVQ